MAVLDDSGYLRNQAGITCAYLAADPSWHARAVALLDTTDPATTAGAWASAEYLTYQAVAHMRAGDPGNKRAARLLQRRPWYGSPDPYGAQSCSSVSMLT